jgi:hypothetical protein
MPRWLSTVVGVAAAALAVWLVAVGFRPPKAIGHDPSPLDAGEDGGPALASAGRVADAGAYEPDAEPAGLGSSFVEMRVDGGPGTTLDDGTPVPPLPPGAPRQVRFGVVLVSYAGAQPSVPLAMTEGRALRPSTRSKADARALSAKLLASAEQDFHAAVQQGDTGSAADVGRVKLGILEPAPEYVLFTLGVGAVGGPVDTPRGYWIVKRLE